MLSVVIPSFNRKESVLALLADVYRQKDIEFEVIVVDDCSPDGSYEAIQDSYPQVVLLKNEKNQGPAVTRNRGILAAKGEVVVGFDSDVTVPDVNTLSKVVKIFEQSATIACVAFRLLGEDSISDDAPRWWHPFPLESHALKDFETFYFSGTAYAIRRQPALAAGLFPEWLYMHFEEVILSLRLLDEGWVIQYRAELSVVHHARPTDRRSLVQTYYKPRNQYLVAYNCYPFFKATIYLFPRIIYGFLVSLSGGHLLRYFRASFAGIKLISSGSVERRTLKRATWQKLRAIRRRTSPAKL